MTNEDWSGYPDRHTARRAAARRFHPDIGGTQEKLDAAFAEIDARFRPSIVIAHSKKSNALRIARRIYRKAGKRIPGRSNRYITL
ncbi:MAG: hypothetical protein GX610_13050 [Rhodococcus sp.]|nr:hypothetical protein [Rhodococcus sp. (in: high G+C Gram-positive bacteria)]